MAQMTFLPILKSQCHWCCPECYKRFWAAGSTLEDLKRRADTCVGVRACCLCETLADKGFMLGWDTVMSQHSRCSIESHAEWPENLQLEMERHSQLTEVK